MSTPHLLADYLKTLRLPTMLKELAPVSRQCTEQDGSYEAFLERLAELEVNARHAKAIERRLRQAHFPVSKELSEFDFKAVPKLNAKRVHDLARCEFISQKSNVILIGAPGLGKTHLALSIAREACRRGHRVRFFTAAGLVNTYVEAREQRQILRLESQIARCDLVVLDELGYIPFGKTSAEHLFSFFSQCYERTSLLITTNLPFSDWPQTFGGDERMTGAILDRLTHRVHLLELRGNSYRLQASLKAMKGEDA